MTITEYANNLADQVRAEGVEGPSLRLALQLVVQLWLDIDRDGASEAEWGLFATDVQTVEERLFPAPPKTTFILEPAELDDINTCSPAVRDLVHAVADVLRDASRQPGQSRVWEYAAAAQRLHNAAEHLP
jgi:hypothetical protein